MLALPYLMYNDTSFKSADSDSDSNESELGEGGEYYAERFKLRLQLRKWESDFVSAEGRAAVYEDKKLDKEVAEDRKAGESPSSC